MPNIEQKVRPNNSQSDVGLDLNRRLRFQGIHDLDAVIVALKSSTTALLSWTSFTLNFVIRNPHRPSALSRMQRFLGMIVAEGELTSDKPQRSTLTLNAVRLVLSPEQLSPARS
jgi:hypothetical protein